MVLSSSHLVMSSIAASLHYKLRKERAVVQSLAGAEPLKVGLIREVCGSKRNAACGRCKVDAAVPAGAGLGACGAGSHKYSAVGAGKLCAAACVVF